VSLQFTGHELVLRVEDKGVGFDLAAVRSHPGLGLSSIEERVRLIGAELSVISAPQQGTIVIVRVPVSESAS
jgi:signal transduction histidine kinase